MIQTVEFTADMRRLVCPSCGCIYCIPEKMVSSRKEQGGNWYCPNGHTSSFCETELDSLKKQLQEETEQALRLDTELTKSQKEVNSTKRQLKKLHKQKGL